MDRQVLSARMRERMGQAAERIGQTASGSLRDMAQMERLIYAEADALKASMLQAWAEAASEDTGRPCCPGCGGRKRQKQTTPKTSASIGGGAAPARRLFSPLDETTTVGGCAITPEAGRIAVEEAADRSYERAVEHLRRDHRLCICKQTLERVTESVGTYWLERDETEYETLEANAGEAVKVEPPPDQCLIYADGVMVHSDGAWHEARVGHVRSKVQGVESEAPSAQAPSVHSSSTARLCDIPTFEKDLWRKARQMGYDQARLAAFIADGSHWLWNLAGRNFEKAVQILDFYHLCQHVHGCGAVFFGEGSEQSRQWSLEVCGTLRAGQVEAVLERVESLPGRSKLKRKAKHELVTYLNNNRDRMDYPRYEAMGLPIGSGPVEAQCKVLVQARCKQAGMRWKKAGLEALLRVRCAVRDGSYEQKFGRWPVNFTAWNTQRRKAA